MYVETERLYGVDALSDVDLAPCRPKNARKQAKSLENGQKTSKTGENGQNRPKPPKNGRKTPKSPKNPQKQAKMGKIGPQTPKKAQKWPKSGPGGGRYSNRWVTRAFHRHFFGKLRVQIDIRKLQKSRNLASGSASFSQEFQKSGFF